MSLVRILIHTEEKPYDKSVHTKETNMYDFIIVKVSTGAKIRSRYNQVPHPTQLINLVHNNNPLSNLLFKLTILVTENSWPQRYC